jgi:Mannosyltransferase (PIG-V)
VLDVLAAFLVTRVTLVVVAAIAVSALPISSAIPLEWLRPGLNPIFESFSRWDSLHYLDIAWGGYRTSDPSSPAFFPLFPMVVRLVGEISRFADPPGLYAMAVVVANVALFVAAVELVQLARLDFDDATASRAGWYLMVFPTSFFLSAAYGESLFLALSLGSVLACRRGLWWQAGLLGGLAALTRPFGVLIVLPLVIEAWHQRSERPLWRMGLAMLPIPAAVLGYMAYLGFQFGDPLAFLNAQAGWDRSLMAPWDTIGKFLDGPFELNSGPHSLVDFAFMLLAVGLALASWKVLRRSYAVYISALVIFPLLTGSLVSFPRFVLTFFPMFLVMGLAGRWPTVDRAVMIVGMGVGALFMGLYARWYWVA